MIKKDANLYILRLASLFLFFEFIFEDGVRLLESFIVNYKLNNLEICFFYSTLNTSAMEVSCTKVFVLYKKRTSVMIFNRYKRSMSS